MRFCVPGFRASGLACGIKAAGEPDLALIVSDRPATVAGVFTTSRFPGAPVLVTRPRVRQGRARAFVVNSGNANVATGAAGLAHAQAMAARVAERMDLRPEEVLVASTGVIGRPFPIARVRRHVPDLVRTLSPTGWRRAARAILRLSQTNQVLFFTCHPDTVERFRNIQPDLPLFKLENHKIELVGA